MKKKKYSKPVIVHSEHLEAVAAACPIATGGKSDALCTIIQS